MHCLKSAYSLFRAMSAKQQSTKIFIRHRLKSNADPHLPVFSLAEQDCGINLVC